MSPARKAVTELVRQFPDAPAKTLARRLYREHPALWRDLESCRTMVREVLGVRGDHNRKHTADKTHFRPPRKAGWTDVIPEALTQLDHWKAFEISGPQRALILSDLHIPYHHPEALEVALQYGSDRKPTLIILNGDIVDHYSLSRFETNPKQRDFLGEVVKTRHFLTGLRKRFPKTRLCYLWGNHELRWNAFMRLKAPEFLDIPEFSWEALFELQKHRIELIRDKQPIRLGSLNVLHGHEHARTISAPVNPARGLYLRAKCHAICGHWHQSSHHSEKNLEQKVISTWSTGCLCELHPEYMPINSWQHGAAWVEVDKAGAFQVTNFRILNGKAY